MRFRKIFLISAGLFGSILLLVCSAALPARAAGAQSDSRPAMNAEDMAIEKARIFMAEKKYEEAIRNFQEAVKINPKNAVTLNMIGIAYLNLNNYDQARKYFERSSKADKKYPSAVNNLGMVYYHQKNFKRAIREYQRAETIDPQQPGTHANLGFAYYNTNKVLEAATEFQKAIELDPQIFEHNDRVGSMVQDRSVTNHGLFFFTMARVYAQKNDAPHCAEYLRKSLDEGYKEVGKAYSDPAFKGVVNDPAVHAVLVRVAPIPEKPDTQHPGA